MRFVEGMTDPPDSVDIEGLREAVSVDEIAMAVLFGSTASGSIGPLSDIDVAVQFVDTVDRSRRTALLDRLTTAIIDATGMEAVDLVDLDRVGPRFGYEILATGTLLTGDRAEKVDLETSSMLQYLDFQPVKQAWDDALIRRIRDGTYGRS